MSEDIQQVELCGFKNFQYKVDVNVMLQMLDFSYRSNNKNIIVALLGTVYPNKIEVVNCFKHVSTLQTQVDNIQKVYPKQYVIGYGANVCLQQQSAQMYDQLQMLHKQYYDIMQKQSATTGQSPFFLTLDLNAVPSIHVQGYVDEQQGMALDQNLIFYQPVHIQLELFNADHSQMNEQNKQISIENFELVVRDLKQNLEIVEEYVEKVLSGEIVGEASVGLAVKKLLREVPTIAPANLQPQLQLYLEDVSLIMYLKNLLNLQAVISDNINKIHL